MGNYKTQIGSALERTAAWHLATVETKLFDQPTENVGCGTPLHKQREYWEYTEALSRSFPFLPEFRANNCIFVHLQVAMALMRQMCPHAPILTIGDVIWLGDSCFNVTPDSLRSALDAGPAPGAVINLHVWLTFPDLTVLDLTLPPWQCKHNREAMNLAETGALRVFGNPDKLRPHIDYKPMLIGPEFLWQTGSVPPHDQHTFQETQQAWLESKLVR